MNMNEGYSQSNKKGEMAAKMVTKYQMNGKATGAGGGMKPKMNGTNSGAGGGMKPTQQGKDTGYARGMKPDMSNKKHSFSSNYTQNGRPKNQ